MKYQNTFVLGVLAVLVLSLAFASAAAFTASPTPIEFFKTSSKTISIYPTNNTSVSTGYIITLPTIHDDTGATIALSLSNSSITSGLNDTVTTTITATVDPSKLSYNANYTGNLTITADGTSSQIIPVRIEKSYCDSGEIGSEIEITSVSDESSGDEYEWSPLKDIELQVTVENKNADDSKRVTVEVGLFDVDSGKFIDIADDEKSVKMTERIDSDDEIDYNFAFTLPADLDEADDYRLYVKAYKSGDEEVECTSLDTDESQYFKEVSVEYDEEVIIDQITAPSTMICGSSDTVSLKLYNLDVGDEEKFRMNLFNSELGVNVFSEGFELDNGDSKSVTMALSVPSNAKEKDYTVSLIVEYGYKESTGEYTDTNTENSFVLKVAGNCVAPAPVVAASLESAAQVGEDLVVKVTVTNPTTNTSDFTVTPTGYESWATLVDPESSPTLSIGAGQSKEVSFTFSPTKSGSQTFDLNIVSNGQTSKQHVAVPVSEGSSLFGGMFSGMSSTTIYLILGIILLLIIIVIVLIVKASKGKSEFEDEE